MSLQFNSVQGRAGYIVINKYGARRGQDTTLLLNTVPREGRIHSYYQIPCQGRAGYGIIIKCGAKGGQDNVLQLNTVPREGRIRYYYLIRCQECD